MDLLSPIILAVAAITLVGLAARFVIWREVRPQGRLAPAGRAGHARMDSSNESGGRVVYRRMMVE